MVSLPAYRVAPPDVLQMEVLKLIPKPPYRIDIYDVLMIRVYGTPLEAPIDGYYLVDEEGNVDLGPEYGKARIAGMSIDEATSIVTQYLRQILQRADGVDRARPNRRNATNHRHLFGATRRHRKFEAIWRGERGGQNPNGNKRGHREAP